MDAEASKSRFVEMVDRHQAIVHRVAGLYAWTPEDRRDLFQEIVYQLWRSWPGFRGDAAVSTWIYRIALNTALTGLRRLRGRLEAEGVDFDPARPPEPAELIDRDRRRESLRAAIGALAPTDRALVLLHLDGLGHREIGETLGISENLVAVKLHRIRGRLREMLSGRSDDGR